MHLYVPHKPPKRCLFRPLLLAVGMAVGVAVGMAGGPTAHPAAAQGPPAAPPIYLPIVRNGFVAPERTIAAVPVSGKPTDRPAAANADLNLALRGFVPAAAPLVLVDYGGSTDSDPPQLAHLVQPPRRPRPASAYRVYDWNWACGADGCRSQPLASPPVTLLGLGVTPGEPLHVPARRAEIYAGGFAVLILYADAERVTLKYTREDSPVYGYTLHVEGFVVDPNLVARYRALDAAGRRSLPGLHSGDFLGWAAGSEVKIAVRDTGTFMDPRSRKDWWQGW